LSKVLQNIVKIPIIGRGFNWTITDLGVRVLLAIVRSVGLTGLEGYIVDVEVDISRGLPGLEIVGLPDTSVRESRERVRAAIRNSGMEFPMGRITVNLAPADLRKEGPVFDLPIAVGLMAASGHLKNSNYKRYIYFGELSLDGAIRGVTGILPSVAAINQAGGKAGDIEGVIVPAVNADEAALPGNVCVFPVKHLAQVIRFIEGQETVENHWVDIENMFISESLPLDDDMSDISGQARAKRALEIAAAGGHNVLMIGPPGSGKTMMARRLSRIVPRMSLEEAIDVTKIYSVAGLLNNSEAPLVTARPFRSPHHSITKSGMVGGGTYPKPGEISLSHCGVLFLDELPEFNRDTLESLRQPLEDGRVRISRIGNSILYPADVTVIAAMNPCPCGYHGDELNECSCTPLQISRYRNKISGPLLDRFDIHIEVPRVSYADINSSQKSESSKEIRRRVEKARTLQKKRLKGTGICSNAGMGSRDVRTHCKIEGNTADLMREAFDKLHLSARAYSRVLKVARTIADLQDSERIMEVHIAEALQYRCIDRNIYQ